MHRTPRPVTATTHDETTRSDSDELIMTHPDENGMTNPDENSVTHPDENSVTHPDENSVTHSGKTIDDVDSTPDSNSPLLAVKDLEKHYPITKGVLRREVGQVRAVDGVSFTLERGETFGLVGESGCGKTTTALSILQLEEPTGGEIRFDGEPVAEHSAADRRAFRRRVQLVVQDPNEAFNPRMTVGEAVAEPLAIHGMEDAERRRAIVTELLERVGLAAADADRYPHEFSDGEKQRIAIARALVLDPDLIVADEPTSALDARVRSDVLALLDELRGEFDIAVLFISHDIDVVAQFCDRMAVMYLGELVERGPVDAVLDSPAHPYTRLLLDSVPSLDPADRELPSPLTDTIPEPEAPPPGCRFHTRCPEVIPPEDAELSSELWRRIAEFRFTLEAEDRTLEEVLDRWDPETDGPIDESTIRDRFGLPDELPDETAGRAVSDAIEALLDGDGRTACDRLADTFTTPCEREQPVDAEHNDRPVRCHRYDPDVDAEPLHWS